MSERFIEATVAYETLHAAIKRASASPGCTGIQTKHKGPAGMQNRTNCSSDHFYFGPMPKFKLLIGQYRYYSGRISWKVLIDAIAWQKSSGPFPVRLPSLANPVAAGYQENLTGARDRSPVPGKVLPRRRAQRIYNSLRTHGPVGQTAQTSTSHHLVSNPLYLLSLEEKSYRARSKGYQSPFRSLSTLNTATSLV